MERPKKGSYYPLNFQSLEQTTDITRVSIGKALLQAQVAVTKRSDRAKKSQVQFSSAENIANKVDNVPSTRDVR